MNVAFSYSPTPPPSYAVCYLTGNTAAASEHIIQRYSRSQRVCQVLGREEGGGAVIFLNDSIERNLRRLDAFAGYEDNWNGYGAEALDPNVIEQAQKLIRRFDRQPFIAPTARQSIQMEFEKPNGDYLEIEVFSDRAVMYKAVGKDEDEREYPFTTEEMNSLIEGVKRFNG